MFYHILFHLTWKQAVHVLNKLRVLKVVYSVMDAHVDARV